MKNPEKDFNPENWNDFTHTSSVGRVTNEQLFENFKTFRSQFGNLPRRELIERGWIESNHDTSSVARLFFALNADRNNALFRKSSSADEALLAMWMALVREKAEYTCVAQRVPEFHPITKQQLKALARLSVEVSVIRELPTLLASYGIILVYLRALTGTKLDGVAFQLSSGHMVVGMTFRFPRLDYFWFTLMHELAHLVLHGNLLEQPILVDVEKEDADLNEKRANKLAKDSFVDRISWRSCEPKYQSGDDAVREYALREGVHPSIVAGLLRKESGDYRRYSGIINQYDVRKIIFGQ